MAWRSNTKARRRADRLVAPPCRAWINIKEVFAARKPTCPKPGETQDTGSHVFGNLEPDFPPRRMARPAEIDQ